MSYLRLAAKLTLAWGLFWALIAASEPLLYDLAARAERRFGSLGW